MACGGLELTCEWSAGSVPSGACPCSGSAAFSKYLPGQPRGALPAGLDELTRDSRLMQESVVRLLCPHGILQPAGGAEQGAPVSNRIAYCCCIAGRLPRAAPAYSASQNRSALWIKRGLSAGRLRPAQCASRRPDTASDPHIHPATW